jgi:16S rRNA (adenine1518-N6/adenine1519-N6)-dimethyltransferase
MDLPIDVKHIPSLLRKYGLYPDKRLGQNFLIDSKALEKIIQSAEINKTDVVLEIGAGVGNLTAYLAATAFQVACVELDRRLIPLLREVLAPFNNIRIIQGDILALSPSDVLQNLQIPHDGYLVVANIPYYITSAVIRHLLESQPRPKRVVLTVQSEVAERICARIGEMSLLALGVQVYGQPAITARIPAGAFYPPPKVNSAVVRVDLYPQPAVPHELIQIFFQLAKAGFGQKRKTLRNSLASGLKLTPGEMELLLVKTQIDPQRRAETLSVQEWTSLAEAARSFI